MKNLLFIALVLLCTASFAQQGNFKLDNERITWQNVYHTENPKANIKKTFENNEHLTITNSSENTLYGRVVNLGLDYDKPGLEDVKPSKNLDTTNIFNGNFRVDFHDNGYQVSVWNLTTTITDYVYTGSGAGIRKQIASPVEKLLLRRNKKDFRKDFYNTHGKVIDFALTDLMDVHREGDNL